MLTTSQKLKSATIFIETAMIMLYKITQGNQYNYHKLTLKPLNKKSFKGVGYTARALKGLKVLQLEVEAQRALITVVTCSPLV